MRSTNDTLFFISTLPHFVLLNPLDRLKGIDWIGPLTVDGFQTGVRTASKRLLGLFLHTDFYFRRIEKEPIQLPPHFPFSSHQNFYNFNTGKKKNLLHRISTEPERLSPDSSAVDVAKHRSPSSPCELYDVDFDWWGNQTASSSAVWTELWNH